MKLLAFGTFAFPVLWVLTLLTFFVWLIRKRWMALFLFVVLAITYNHWGNVFQWKGREVNPSELSKSVSVMSFNVRMFDYYDWMKQPGTRQEIFDFVNQESPDILCIQEFFSDERNAQFTINSIVKKLGNYPYRHIEFSKIWRNGCSFGLATLSKYPITGREVIRFENTTNFSSRTDIHVKGTTIRVFNNHLESIRLQAKNFNFIDSINYKADKERLAGIRSIVRKVNNAFHIRSTQADVVAAKIQESPHPVVVCGDFNDTPVSYVYHTIRGDLADAFVESGKGFGGTYNGKLPSYRIDYVFHSRVFKSYNFKRHPESLSDHFPISCLLEIQ